MIAVVCCVRGCVCTVKCKTEGDQVRYHGWGTWDGKDVCKTHYKELLAGERLELCG